MNILGKDGEDLACEYVKNKLGYLILHRNYNCGTYGELDIVCLDKENRYVFVEVKSRSSDTFMDINQAVNYRKRQALKHASLFYISKENIKNTSFRIDLVTYNKYSGDIEYFEDVLDG